ncbi:hypothetical protein CLV24_11443 [Pontibacter ummariensis]|uniref:Uncharacterized protein n=1 Tax=Pontibacter ummariensis TaxID=1610492 RepID=A0A239HKZ2_9BACT|nr:hypothetical protein [Pontibacter ummariensis]PRY10315.1 hypothetical protein CLV24_11443 [Pontibacter ummariensis]SNS82066.1 hypothetical protein SAMN06296052_11443 [Pontibacter ummariensis]
MKTLAPTVRIRCKAGERVKNKVRRLTMTEQFFQNEMLDQMGLTKLPKSNCQPYNSTLLC